MVYSHYFYIYQKYLFCLPSVAASGHFLCGTQNNSPSPLDSWIAATPTPTSTHRRPFVAPPKNHRWTVCHTWDGTFTNLNSICGALQGDFCRGPAMNSWTEPLQPTPPSQQPTHRRAAPWPLAISIFETISLAWTWKCISGTLPSLTSPHLPGMDFILEYYLFIRPVAHLWWICHGICPWMAKVYIYSLANCAFDLLLRSDCGAYFMDFPFAPSV